MADWDEVSTTRQAVSLYSNENHWIKIVSRDNVGFKQTCIPMHAVPEVTLRRFKEKCQKIYERKYNGLDVFDKLGIWQSPNVFTVNSIE